MKDDVKKVIELSKKYNLPVGDHLEGLIKTMDYSSKKELIDYVFDRLDNYQLRTYLLQNTGLLNEPIVRDILFSDKRHYTFIWIIQAINNLSFMDEDFTCRILSNNKCIEKISAIINFCNDISFFLSDKRILEKIFSSDIPEHFFSLNYCSALPIMKYMLKHNLLYYFGNFTPFVQNEFLKDERIRLRILSSIYLKNAVKNIDSIGFELLISDERFRKVIVNSNLDFIKNLILNNVYFPLEISLNPKFKNTFLNIEDVSEYRYIMDKLERNNGYAVSEIDKERDKLYDKIISGYKDGFSASSLLLISYLKLGKDINDIISLDLRNFSRGEKDGITADLLYRYDTYCFRDILIDRVFKDIPYNFLKNLGIMINYADKLSSNVFDKNRYSIYKRILNFDHLSFDDKMKLYKECVEYPNFMESFYDDYRYCRDHVYSDLVDSSLSLKSCLSLEKSKSSGVDVYELNGEDFYAFVHVTDIYKYEVKSCRSCLWTDGNREFLSLSYIGNNSITVYRNPHDFIIFGFSDLDYKRIVHLRESDSFSFYGYDNVNSSRFIQKMYTPSDLIENTNGYNEVLYQEKKTDIQLSKVKPSFVVCYDEIMDGDTLAAKHYNIPIVLINTKKYNFNQNVIDADENDTYHMIDML